MADEPRSYDPDSIEANRGREQGLGVGQRDLDAQRDPDQLPQTPLELDNDDEPLRSEPGDEGAVLNANHANRGAKPDRSSGPKTRQASKDQISRRS
ncbi:hypothetical protein [Phenylobacterium sp.]|uniref:hypothetical protein n=1 Tax=Phenylobacterium sp. TaxID=1871053 RepID=UPI0011FFCE88|nr:hypothetical protein [Phenylobacterium sp.]THD61800.1 MAG: hypothetical protein E8A49_09490 [Phenylobacterium sp.]